MIIVIFLRLGNNLVRQLLLLASPFTRGDSANCREIISI